MDVAYTYLTYFEDDDEKLAKIYDTYKTGELLTGELKKLAVDLLQEYVGDFQVKRAEVTDEVLAEYMRPRKLESKATERVGEMLAKKLASRPKPKEKATKEKKEKPAKEKEEKPAEKK